MEAATAIRSRDILRFGLSLALLGAAVIWSYGRPELYRLFGPVETWTAAATEWLLLRCGSDVERVGRALSHSGGFAYTIGYRCTGLVVAAFLAVGLLAAPLPRRIRLRGLIVGVPVVLAANLARLVSLFLVGVHWPAAFDFAHLTLWEGAMVLVILAVWAGCWKRLDTGPGTFREPRRRQQAATGVS